MPLLTALATTVTPAASVATIPARHRTRSSAWFTAAVIAAYVVIGEAAFWPVLPWSSQHLFGAGGDSILAMWFLAWVPHSLAHGLNPFFSNALFVPTGVNLVQNTEAPFLGLLTAPFAPILGPLARGNLLMVLAMPVSATAAFVVFRKWQVWGPAAALGGLIYGFSPFAVGQSLGHLVLVFVPLPPFIAFTVVSILQRRGSPVRLGIQLGLLLTAQFLSEAEVFTTVVIVTAWALICAAIARPAKARDALSAAVRPVGIALCIVVALLAYPLWMLLAGPQRYAGTAQPVVNPYYNDLLSFVSPGPLQRLSLGVHSLPVAPSNAAEIDGFIGIPLVLLAIYFAWRSRRSGRMQLTIVVLLGAAVLSLGPHLAINHHLTSMPLPFAVLTHTPLLDNILPSRISLEVIACVAAVIAFGLDDIRRQSHYVHRHRSSRPHRAASVLAVVVLAALIVSWLPRWPYGYQSAEALPVEVSQATPSGDPVALTYPYASPLYPQPMLWQVEEGFRFRLLGGYAEHPDPNGQPTGFPNPFRPAGLDLFLEGQEGYNRYLPPVPVTPALLSTTQTTFNRYDVRLFIVDRSVKGSETVVGLLTKMLGAPTVADGRFVLWSSDHGPL
jgi:hypothetical protein